MVKGTRIFCHNEEDLQQILDELCEAGYGAEHDSSLGYVIVITSVPKQEGNL